MKLEKRDSPTMISLHFYHVSRWWFRCHSSFRPLPGANVTSHSISRCKTQPFSSRLYKTVPKMVREKRFVAFLCLCKSTQSIPHIWKTVFSHLEPSHQSHYIHSCSHSIHFISCAIIPVHLSRIYMHHLSLIYIAIYVCKKCTQDG